MSQPLNVHLLPDLTTPEELAGGMVVVIDVLRASTTITHALAAGASEVIPCLEIDDARQAASRLEPGRAILGGERSGLPIDGFDLGNSPQDYTPQSVGGKTVVFTTTNGTKAMMQCRQASQVVIGSFVNFLAVCRTLTRSPAPIHLLCAGTAGKITREDAALAGSIAFMLLYTNRDHFQLNDQAAIVLEMGRQILAAAVESEDQRLAIDNAHQVLAASQGGRNLKRIGLADDIIEAAQIDRFSLVPTLDLNEWRITAEG
jgi:2-phosphosulfolactate phosphatase